MFRKELQRSVLCQPFQTNLAIIAAPAIRDARADPRSTSAMIVRGNVAAQSPSFLWPSLRKYLEAQLRPHAATNNTHQ
jgi:hypothetical protein